MEKNIVTTIIGAAALSATAIAGPIEAPITTTETSSGDFCETLKSLGKLYKDSSNPYIQEFSVFGRFQYQTAYHEGSDFAGNDSNDTHSEVRRTRLGVKIKAFNGLQLKANVNLEDGGDKDHGFGYTDFDTATVSYNFGSLGAIDDFSLSYGRHKHTLTEEAHTSSKKIKTIERSNISNLFYGSYRPTGLVASGSLADIDLKLGVYSTDDGSEFIGGWNDGFAYYANAQWDKFNFDFLYNDVSAGDDDLFGQDWATSLSYNTEIGNWDLMANAVYGKLSNGESAYGLVVMPSTFIIPDKVEFVTRYQYAGSSADTLKLTKRYARGVEGGAGDSNHTLYAGLNYFFCDHNSKLQAGVEYETLENVAGDSADATTLWLAYRMYF